MLRLLLTLILPIFFILSCRKSYYNAKTVYHIASVNNNVNKKLFGRVILYGIFVDNRKTHPWTTYDIASTMDSVRKAMSWVMAKSKENNIDLNIEFAFHQNKNIIPIEGNLYEETIWKTLFVPNLKEGIENFDMWSNRIARKAGEAFPADTSTMVQTKNVITDRERLIARLRDKYKTDNVVLMYFVNNYHYEDISLVLHSSGSDDTEYAIVSFKYPAVIAHEFLHTFGAVDLYMSPFDKKKRTLKNKVQIMEAYPNEIMAFTHRAIESMDISPITKYMVGWSPVLEEKDQELLFGTKLRVYKY